MEKLNVKIPICDRPDQWARGYLDSLSLKNYIQKVSFENGLDGNYQECSWLVVWYFKKLEIANDNN